MLHSLEASIGFLANADARIRRAAICVIGMEWRPPPGSEFTALCERMALEDPDLDVRCAALGELGHLYMGTDDVRIGRLLAGIVRDEAQPNCCRLAAYLALFLLRGLVPPLLPLDPKRAELPVRIPEDVDWSFVDSFFIEGREPTPARRRIDEAILEHAPEPMRTAMRLFMRGCDAYDLGLYDQCVEFLTRSIGVRRSPLAYLRRGGAYVKMGRFDEAIADFTSAIELMPFSARAYRSRSVAYRLKGLRDLAQADEEKAIELEEADQGTRDG